jgi:hypothetical protein
MIRSGLAVGGLSKLPEEVGQTVRKNLHKVILGPELSPDCRLNIAHAG